MNVFISGVGGQGSGMLSEILVRAVDYSGKNFRAVDTHGLAQRGGTVVSQIRYGENVYTPLIKNGEADICIALEMHEALRSMEKLLKDDGLLIYYDTVWEPLGVRLGKDTKISENDILKHCSEHGIKSVKAFDKDLEDTRMQNIVILAHIVRNNLMDGITVELIEKAMGDLMTGSLLDANIQVFRRNLE